ncbi:hypothetical protein [Mesorhizobium sp. DCY119]|uniref:hypothetical protein n=2 Tax=Mesorhizobium sp. DCY119 TaxID=2108445 RepID=UPI000E6BDF6E|nr:hypothetical protein [Mesorhizobium sp. DCY119]
MMTAQRSPVSSLPPPLLVWREQSEMARIEEECQSLAVRISGLRPRSHYRLELEVRLRDLRSRQMRLECQLSNRK